jgi:hypothetical protein
VISSSPFHHATCLVGFKFLRWSSPKRLVREILIYRFSGALTRRICELISYSYGLPDLQQEFNNLEGTIKGNWSITLR